MVSLVALALGLGALVPAVFFWNARGPQAATEIFAGVVYGCERLAPTDEGSGLLHWVRIDLTAPGIELYVTPLDPVAVSAGLAISPGLDRGRGQAGAPRSRHQRNDVHLKLDLAAAHARRPCQGRGNRGR